MPEILVTDANILIDLAIVLEHELLLLPDHDVYTTYDVFYELRAEQRNSWQPYVDAERIRLEEVEQSAVDELREEVSRRLSDPDCTVVVLAETRQAIIVSGDRLLVKAYRKRGREAHGILWLLDENERINRYTASQLHHLLTEIRKVNQWLPAKLCEERLSRWREEE
ncbi:hypothetical protein [Lewinella sp. W8]|uniref:hypothetical protein n=1 Tax=Lewinella sp. W8 TaxID=2528208 RepID=UPI00106821FF|nr:hypothetical protein [Lewinella sp. W8]MTB51861.1 hypothetical protein [Lewinella sp. W8]